MEFSKDPFTRKVTGNGELQPVLEHIFVGLLKLTTYPYAKVGCDYIIVSRSQYASSL